MLVVDHINSITMLKHDHDDRESTWDREYMGQSEYMGIERVLMYDIGSLTFYG